MQAAQQSNIAAVQTALDQALQYVPLLNGASVGIADQVCCTSVTVHMLTTIAAMFQARLTLCSAVV